MIDSKTIAISIWRSGFIKDRNKIRQAAKERMRHLIAIDIAAQLSNTDSSFNEDEFMKTCGFSY